MATIDIAYQELCKKVLHEGREYPNKNRGVKRLQIPSHTFRHDLLNDGFPMITNKKMWLKGIVGELIWFLRGDNNVKYLNDNKIKIWNKDAYNWAKKQGGDLSFEEFESLGSGSVGKNYSVQWRNFNNNTDQIKDLIEGMLADIMSSRLIVTAWNPSELDATALPSCHNMFQVIGIPLTESEREIIRKKRGGVDSVPKFGFQLNFSMRSVDLFLGLPYNIASYAALAKILEAITGFPCLAIEGELKCIHFYDNQYEAAEKLLERSPFTHPNCELEMDFTEDDFKSNKSNNICNVFNFFEPKHFKLNGYTSDEEIKVEMLAPKSI